MKKNIHIQIILIAAISIISNFAIAASDDHDHDHDHGAHDSDSQFYGHLDLRVHIDSITSAAESDEKFDEIYSHSHLELGMRLDENFTVNTNIKLEGESFGHAHGHGGEEESANGDNRYFKEHPLLVEQLTLNYKNNDYSYFIGKFNPIIGFSYHSVPGIYGYSQIEEYTVREKVGMGGSIKYNANSYGSHELDFSTFFSDTSILSESYNHQRGRTNQSSGGVGNTEDLSSFAVSLGGSDFYSLGNNNIIEGLSYRLGYAHQAKGVGNEEDEDRYSASLGYKYQISNSMSAKFVTELMDIEHLGGEAGHDRSHHTTALKLSYKAWNFGTSYTHTRNDAEEEDESINGHVYQISGGYSFDNGIGLDLGYKYSDKEAEVKERVGAMISYDYEF